MPRGGEPVLRLDVPPAQRLDDIAVVRGESVEGPFADEVGKDRRAPVDQVSGGSLLPAHGDVDPRADARQGAGGRLSGHVDSPSDPVRLGADGEVHTVGVSHGQPDGGRAGGRDWTGTFPTRYAYYQYIRPETPGPAGT